MSSQVPAFRGLEWQLFQYDVFGSAMAPKPLDEPHRRWAAALDAAGLHARTAGLIRCHAEMMKLEPATMARDGYSLIDLQHARAMATLGHPAELVRAVARVAMSTGREDKAALDQRARRLAARAFKE